MGIYFAYVVMTLITDASVCLEYLRGPVCLSIPYPWESCGVFVSLFFLFFVIVLFFVCSFELVASWWQGGCLVSDITTIYPAKEREANFCNLSNHRENKVFVAIHVSTECGGGSHPHGG